VRSDRLAMRKRTNCTPAQRAAKHLRRIPALTGATQVQSDSYRLTVGRMHFLVNSKFVSLISPRGESTCFYVAADPDMPSFRASIRSLLLPSFNRVFFRGSQTKTFVT